jgi:acyl-CoA hydrolase
VDEAAWIAASIDYPHCQWVTIAMNSVEFLHSVRDGTILRISSTRKMEGNTSVTYQITVTDMRTGPRPIFSTDITLVNVDAAGAKRPIRA